MTLPDKRVKQMWENRGFTLLEALLVLAITGILVSASIPSFRATVGRYQVSSQADSFLSMVKLARVTAAENLQKVRICPSLNQATCNSAGGYDWRNGYIVLLDSADDGSFSEVTQVISAVSVRNTINLRDGDGTIIPSLTFRSLGILEGIASATFEFRMPNCTGLTNRNVSIAFNGRTTNTSLDC